MSMLVIFLSDIDNTCIELVAGICDTDTIHDINDTDTDIHDTDIP